MKTEITFTTEPIDEAALVARRSLSSGMGAVLCFCGVVRGTEHGQAIAALEYEAFQRMARHQCDRLFAEMGQRWPIESVRLVHRLGEVQVSAVSLWVEIIAPHRAEAFAAGQWLVDELKRLVPIWKRPLLAVQPTTGRQ